LIKESWDVLGNEGKKVELEMVVGVVVEGEIEAMFCFTSMLMIKTEHLLPWFYNEMAKTFFSFFFFLFSFFFFLFLASTKKKKKKKKKTQTVTKI
jgi:uncharacterized protein YqhQ